jgi:hypothetical protein
MMGHRLPLATRLVGIVHGLYYLQALIVPVGLINLVVALTGAVPLQVFSGTTTAWLALVYAVLLLCHGYRQRFYLDPARERGWYWRAGVLQAAKWPVLILALVDVLCRRQVPYVLTRKASAAPKKVPALWPHWLVAPGIGLAWAATSLSGQRRDPSLDLWTMLIILSAGALALTERLPFPAPYDKHLWAKTRGDHPSQT